MTLSKPKREWRAIRADLPAAEVLKLLRENGLEPTKMRAEVVTKLKAILIALQTAKQRRRERPPVARIARAADELATLLGCGSDLLVDMQQSGIADPVGTLTRLRADLSRMRLLRPGWRDKKRLPNDPTTVVYLGELAGLYRRITGKKATVSKTVPSDGETRWGRFIEFAAGCFALAGRRTVAGKATSAQQLAKAWERAKVRTKKRSNQTPP